MSFFASVNIFCCYNLCATHVVYNNIAYFHRRRNRCGVYQFHYAENFRLWNRLPGFYAYHTVFTVVYPYNRCDGTHRVCTFIYGVFFTSWAGVTGYRKCISAAGDCKGTAAGTNNTGNISVHTAPPYTISSSFTVIRPLTAASFSFFSTIFSISPGTAFSLTAVAITVSPQFTVKRTFP